MEMSWSIPREDHDLIAKVVERAKTLESAKDISDAGWRAIAMSLHACQANNGRCCDFERLLAFPDFDFSHDVFGIDRHTSRDTGKLLRGFYPRCGRTAAELKAQKASA